jgi:hypothetical protein
MTEGRKFCGVGTFVKFGGETALHHNMPMPLETLSIVISFSTLASASLPFIDLDGQLLMFNYVMIIIQLLII